MLDDLREASQSLRVAIDRTARRQQAQEEMLQLIVDLLNLQDD